MNPQQIEALKMALEVMETWSDAKYSAKGRAAICACYEALENTVSQEKPLADVIRLVLDKVSTELKTVPDVIFTGNFCPETGIPLKHYATRDDYVKVVETFDVNTLLREVK